jgi:hypothetical protein
MSDMHGKAARVAATEQGCKGVITRMSGTEILSILLILSKNLFLLSWLHIQGSRLSCRYPRGFAVHVAHPTRSIPD